MAGITLPEKIHLESSSSSAAESSRGTTISMPAPFNIPGPSLLSFKELNDKLITNYGVKVSVDNKLEYYLKARDIRGIGFIEEHLHLHRIPVENAREISDATLTKIILELENQNATVDNVSQARTSLREYLESVGSDDNIFLYEIHDYLGYGLEYEDSIKIKTINPRYFASICVPNKLFAEKEITHKNKAYKYTVIRFTKGNKDTFEIYKLKSTYLRRKSIKPFALKLRQGKTIEKKN